MFLKNCWYVAAEPHEITRQPFGRTICNEKIVFWRTEDGDPVAFEDRCCHRRMPLRKGSVQGNILSCHYHGLQFDVTGKCVHVPGQTTIPPGAQVRAYPAVQKYNWIWIWMGDPALADESLIVPYPWKSADDWGDKGTYFHVNGNYKLVIDNLLDLSHLAFVHRSTIGNAAVAEHAVLKTLKDEDSVTVARWTIGQNPPPTYQKMCDWPEETIVDRWQIIEFRMPGAVRLFTGAAPGAAEGKEFGHTELERDVPGDGFGFHNLNFGHSGDRMLDALLLVQLLPGPPASRSSPISSRCSTSRSGRPFHQDWEVFDLQERKLGRPADDRDQPGRRRNRRAAP